MTGLIVISILVLLVAIPNYIGFRFCISYVEKNRLVIGKTKILVIAVLCSIISVCLTFLVFTFTPGLRSLPGGPFDGALVVTLPLFLFPCVLTYYPISLGMFKLAGVLGFTHKRQRINYDGPGNDTKKESV